MLIDNGADVDAENYSGLTPLHCCAWNGHPKVAQALITKGANFNAKHRNNWTPFHYSANNGHPEVARALIKAGADLDARNRDRSPAGRLNLNDKLLKTPLHLIAENGYKSGHLEVARALIEAGADINAMDEDGDTPLHFSAENGNIVVARALIEAGAYINVYNDDILKPLDMDPRLQRNVRPRQGENDQGQGRNVRQRFGGGTNEGVDVDLMLTLGVQVIARTTRRWQKPYRCCSQK